MLDAIDNCDNELAILFTEEQSGTDCPYIITRVWTISDDCGNVNTVQQLMTVVIINNVSDIELAAIPSLSYETVEVNFTIPGDRFVVFEV